MSLSGIEPIPALTPPATTRSPSAASFQSYLEKQSLWLLLLITVFGGALRFTFLTRPTLWGDEAFTFSRVCGEYRQMLDVLAYDGFPPLHYQMYWLIGRITPLTPLVMRLMPAIFGTLMIPAMYFTAVQICNRKIALLSALFTACSAYMLVYSRDAKMYMACWLFATLNVGCFLHWLKTSQRYAFLAWIATGLLMAGMQLVGLTVLALQPIILLSFRAEDKWVGWKKVVLFLAGLLIIASGPLGYKLGFNLWSDRIDEVGFTAGSGIAWVDQYNQGRNGPDLTLSAATAHLYSWEWPKSSDQKIKPGIDPAVMHGLMIAGTALLGLLFIGVMRSVWICAATGSATIHWRSLLWLSLWIIIPCYSTYCISMREFASPMDWVAAIFSLSHWAIWIMLFISLSVLIAILELHRHGKAMKIVAGRLALLAALIWIVVIPAVAIARHHAVTVGWVDRIWTASQAALSAMFDRRWVSAFSLLGLPAIWIHSGVTRRDRLKNTGSFIGVALLILIVCTGIFLGIRFRFTSAVEKIQADHHDAYEWEMYTQRAMIDHGVPTVATAKELIKNAARFTDDDLIEAKYPNNVKWLNQQVAQLIAKKQKHWDERYAVVRAKNGGLGELQLTRQTAERISSEHVAWDRWVSVWMPRYVGVCWPAMAIACVALLSRLPFMPLRVLAFSLMLALNLTQAGARIFLTTEPPLDRIYTDVVAGQSQRHGKPAQRASLVFLSEMTPFNIGHPGSLGITGMAGRYYMTQATGISILPTEFRNFQNGARSGVPWKPWDVTLNLDVAPTTAAKRTLEAAGAEKISEVIIWERTDEIRKYRYSDQVLQALGDQWKVESDVEYHGLFHWNWTRLYTVHRRVIRKMRSA